MTIESRRAIVERVLRKARALGHPIEGDDRFLGWLEEWIAGDAAMSDIRRNYIMLLAEKAAASRDRAVAPRSTATDGTLGDGKDGSISPTATEEEF